MSYLDSILFFVSGNDPVHVEKLKRCKRSQIMLSLYTSRVQQLNELLSLNARMKHLKEKEEKEKRR